VKNTMGKLKNPQEPETTTEKEADKKTYTPEEMQKAYRDGFNDGFSKADELYSEDEEPEE
jgi:hypothetical protein